MEEKQVWNSCCLRIDAQMVGFIVQTVIAATVLALCIAQLFLLSECEQVQPYLSLVTFIVGAYLKPLTQNQSLKV
jgi:hypothetical protein